MNLLDISGKVLAYQDHLIKTDHLKESKDADKIIVEILEPYQGKVVYIDFWGIWCGPCIAEMQYVPAVKQAMEGKDVVFVYLANRTPEEYPPYQVHLLCLTNRL